MLPDAAAVPAVAFPMRYFHGFAVAVTALELDVDAAAELDRLDSLRYAVETVREALRLLIDEAVPLTPQHLHDLAQRAPGLAMPYEVWAPLLASGLRLQEERDRARDCAVALEQELAAYDEQHKAAAP